VVNLNLRDLQIAYRRWVTASVNRRIFGAAATVALMTALVRVMSMGKELLVAWRFGTSDALDAFLVAYLVPSFTVSIVVGSFNAALIPIYIKVKNTDGVLAAEKLLGGVMVWSLGLLAIATAIILVGAPVYLPVLAGGFTAEKLQLARELLYVLSPVIAFSGVATLWGAVLNADKRFALPALFPIATPLLAMVAVILGGRLWGAFALAAGVVCGQIVEALLMGLALRWQGISLRLAWHGFDPNLRQVIGLYVPMIAGALLMSSTQIVDQAMAATLAPGSVAALNYGNKVILLPVSLAVTALGTAVIPYFSDMVAREEWAGVRHTLSRYLGLIFVTTIPVTLLLFAVSGPLVRLLFQRGAFTAQDAAVVANVQALSSLQIPFFVAGILVVRLISSMRANYILMWSAAINVVVNVALNYLFMIWMGVAGIALSTSCMYVLSFLFLFYAWRRLSKRRP